MRKSLKTQLKERSQEAQNFKKTVDALFGTEYHDTPNFDWPTPEQIEKRDKELYNHGISLSLISH